MSVAPTFEVLSGLASIGAAACPPTRSSTR